MKEKAYLIALVYDNKIISLRIYISSFVHCYGKQKSLIIVEKNPKKKTKRYSGKPYTVTSDWQKIPNEATRQAVRWNISGSSQLSRWIKHKQVKSFILNVKWLSNVSLFIAIAVDTSEMRFY